MPRFAANLTWLFTEYPFLDRFGAAASAGFDAVEALFPYDDAPRETAARLAQHGLAFVLMNAPPPNWTGGEPGFTAVPGAEERFRRDFSRALRYAGQLRPLHLHVMAGLAEGLAARASFAANLVWAAAEAPHQSLTIEPINRTDMPGYFLADFDEAAAILDDVGASNLGLQFDAYHAQTIAGDALGTYTRHRARIRHVQVGGLPGRGEPVRGAIDYPGFFARLDADGYTGWVSGEYRPARRTEQGLGWLNA